MILFTKREKQVIIFLICTLVAGYAVKHYKQAHLYDDFNPLSKVEKEAFKETAELTYNSWIERIKRVWSKSPIGL